MKHTNLILRIVAVLVIILVWGTGVKIAYDRYSQWLNTIVETTVYRSPTRIDSSSEYAVYEKRNASQTFHFDNPTNIEKIAIPVMLPNNAKDKQRLNVTIKKDDMTVVEDYVFELTAGRNDLTLQPTKQFLSVKDLRVIFTTPGFNDIAKAPRVYREEGGNIAMRFYSSAVRRDIIFKKSATPKDYVGWYKLALLAGLVVIFPVVLIDPLIRNNKRGD
ncbi:MAG: hypothetical protein Q7S57_02480 [bacterium]|nr:hypothetical protein [bacterium]